MRESELIRGLKVMLCHVKRLFAVRLSTVANIFGFDGNSLRKMPGNTISTRIELERVVADRGSKQWPERPGDANNLRCDVRAFQFFN